MPAKVASSPITTEPRTYIIKERLDPCFKRTRPSYEKVEKVV
ncbi:MAG TPA: hypothetical protein VK622_02190 [Puia sp.]|nr:hypothetical protein [Puia sp.]